nr:R-linalool synthase QH1, chloroplastic-like [Tanacetum cinerariifolium]
MLTLGVASASLGLVARFATVVTMGVVLAITLILLRVVPCVGSHGWRQLVDTKVRTNLLARIDGYSGWITLRSSVAFGARCVGIFGVGRIKQGMPCRGKVEKVERGDIPKTDQCYVHEGGASEAEARSYIKTRIDKTWKKVNKERARANSQFFQEYINNATNIGI